MELTNVGARDRVRTYGLPVAIGLRKPGGQGHSLIKRIDAKGNKIKAVLYRQCVSRGLSSPFLLAPFLLLGVLNQ